MSQEMLQLLEAGNSPQLLANKEIKLQSYKCKEQNPANKCKEQEKDSPLVSRKECSPADTLGLAY